MAAKATKAMAGVGRERMTVRDVLGSLINEALVGNSHHMERPGVLMNAL